MFIERVELLICINLKFVIVFVFFGNSVVLIVLMFCCVLLLIKLMLFICERVVLWGMLVVVVGEFGLVNCIVSFFGMVVELNF